MRRSSDLSVLLTWCRLVPLAGLLWAVADRSVLVPAWVLLVIVADIADGVFARRRNEDGNTRRALDAAIDRVSIHSAFGVALVAAPGAEKWIWLYLPLLARDVIALSTSGVLMKRSDLLLLGGHVHKLASLSCAAFGIALTLDVPAAVIATGTFAVVSNYVLAVDYLGGLFLAKDLELVGRYRIVRLGGLAYLGSSARARLSGFSLEPDSQRSKVGQVLIQLGT